MSYQAVKTCFQQAGILELITEHDQAGGTTEHARAAGWVDVCNGWFASEGVSA